MFAHSTGPSGGGGGRRCMLNCDTRASLAAFSLTNLFDCLAGGSERARSRLLIVFLQLDWKGARICSRAAVRRPDSGSARNPSGRRLCEWLWAVKGAAQLTGSCASIAAQQSVRAQLRCCRRFCLEGARWTLEATDEHLHNLSLVARTIGACLARRTRKPAHA